MLSEWNVNCSGQCNMFPFPLYFPLWKKVSLSFVPLSRYKCFHSCGKSSRRGPRHKQAYHLAFCRLDTFNLMLLILTNDVRIPEDPPCQRYSRTAVGGTSCRGSLGFSLFFFSPLLFRTTLTSRGHDGKCSSTQHSTAIAERWMNSSSREGLH